MTRKRPGRKRRADPQIEADRRIMRGAAAVCGFVYDIRPEAFFRASRGRADESEVRQIMLAVLRRAMEYPGMNEEVSAERLAKAIGRDRSTVSHALHKIEQACEGNHEVDYLVEQLADIVRPLVKIQAIIAGAIAQGVEAVNADDPGDAPDETDQAA